MYVHDMTYLATMKHLLAHNNAPSDWDARVSFLNDPNPAFK
jgi:hypothetical protein